MKSFRFLTVILVFTLVTVFAIVITSNDNLNIKTTRGVFAIGKPLGVTSLQSARNREQLEKRLKELKAEFENGRKMLAELEAKQASLRDTLSRIRGAIQIVEEELAKTDNDTSHSIP